MYEEGVCKKGTEIEGSREDAQVGHNYVSWIL